MYKMRKILFIILLSLPAMLVLGLVVYDQVCSNIITKDMWITICVALISYWGSAVVGYCTFLNSEHIRFIEDTKLMKDNLPEFKIDKVLVTSPDNFLLANEAESKHIFWNSEWEEVLSEPTGNIFANKMYWLEVEFKRKKEIPIYNLSVATADLENIDKLVQVDNLEREENDNLIVLIPFEVRDLNSWKVYHNEFNICFTNIYRQYFYQSVKIDVLTDKETLKFYSAIRPVRGGKRRVCIRRSTIDETFSSKIIEENVLATMHTHEKKQKLRVEDMTTN